MPIPLNLQSADLQNLLVSNSKLKGLNFHKKCIFRIDILNSKLKAQVKKRRKIDYCQRKTAFLATPIL